MTQLNVCLNDYQGGSSQGGMRRAAFGTCPTCGKRIRVRKDGRLWTHGTISRAVQVSDNNGGMQTDRAIDIVARNIVANNDSPKDARVILSPIGPDFVKRVMDRASEIREDLEPKRETFDEAWELLLRSRGA